MAQQPETPSDEFIAALAAAQAEMENAAFDKTNPAFKSKYASLASVRAATLPILNKHGFAVISTTEMIDGELWEKTELAHVSGISRFSYWPIGQGTPQQRGSSWTYGRRYGLSGFAGTASEEDDDGNAASDTVTKPTAYAARKEGLYPTLEREVREQTSIAALKQWWLDKQDDIKTLPASWIVKLEEEKDRRKLEIIDALPDDTEFKNQLKKSALLKD